jgi:Fe2+ or Zn2+ uptake regulation protein
MDTFAARAEAALRRRGGRITNSRRALLQLIESGGRPFSPRELHRELRRRGTRVDRVSVYRNVAALLELGLLHRVVGSAAVRPCVARAERCHHAVVCTACGRAQEFHSPALERALADLRGASGYLVDEHVLELRGLCAACRMDP